MIYYDLCFMNENQVISNIDDLLPNHIKAMCHTDVVAPIVTNRFPYFRGTSSFFDSKH